MGISGADFICGHQAILPAAAGEQPKACRTEKEAGGDSHTDDASCGMLCAQHHSGAGHRACSSSTALDASTLTASHQPL